MRHWTERKLEVDTFVIYTDNETWAGEIHPHRALVVYRQRWGIAAKLIVVGMTATKFTIAGPADGGMLEVVGFGTAAAPGCVRSLRPTGRLACRTPAGPGEDSEVEDAGAIRLDDRCAGGMTTDRPGRGHRLLPVSSSLVVQWWGVAGGFVVPRL